MIRAARFLWYPFSSVSGEAQWYDDEHRTIAKPHTCLLNNATPS